MKIKRLKEPLILKKENIFKFEPFYYYLPNKEKSERNEKTNKKLHK